MIVCIPSKGRPTTRTYKLFAEAGIPVYHFVEPQQVEEYKKAGVPNIVNINGTNQGISYVRNFILDYAKENNHEWIIVCDDDVSRFDIYKNKKNYKLSVQEVLAYLEKAKGLPFEMIGFNYKQYIWVAKSFYSVNTKTVEQCVMLNVNKIWWRYRAAFNLKEDRDFALQTIKYGNGIFRYNTIGIQSPDIGTNAGGLNDEYKQKKDSDAAVKMVKEWHPFIELKKKDQRIDIKLKLKELAQHYKREIK
jgi:glycosyltransferase involved in cell wall biosynthesis